MRITNCVVKCDGEGCDWKAEIDPEKEARLWHNKPCPKCGYEFIFSDSDLEITLAMVELVKAADEIEKVLDPDGKGPKVNMSVEFKDKN